MPENVAVIVRNKTSVAIGGFAALRGQIRLKPPCFVSWHVDLSPWNVTTKAQCNLKALFDAAFAAEKAFLKALEDIERFFSQLLTDFDGLFSHFISFFSHLRLPLLHDLFQRLFAIRLRWLLNPALLARWKVRLANFMAHLASLRLPKLKLEAMALKGFTKIMCTILGPFLSMCHHSSVEFSHEWHLHFVDHSTHTLSQVREHLGGHGVLQLDVNCRPKVNLSFGLDVIIALNSSHGFHLKFPEGTTVSGAMDITTKGCEMDGRLGPVGMDFKADVELDLAFSITQSSPKMSKPSFHPQLTLNVSKTHLSPPPPQPCFLA